MERVSPGPDASLRTSEASQLPRRCDHPESFQDVVIGWRLPLGPLHVWIDDTGTAQHGTGYMYDPGESHFFKHGIVNPHFRARAHMPQAIGSGAPKMMTGVACSATSKVDSWLREARQAQQSGADPNQILKSLIEADIASEARAAAKASKAAARATLQRLQEIASVKSLELRASLASARGEGTMAGDDTGGAGGSMSISGEGQPQPGDVRTYIARSSQRNKSSLPSHLGRFQQS